MGLKPQDKKISDVFKQIDYDIAFYQREYKWKDEGNIKPIESLLNDIFYRFDDHYSKDLNYETESEYSKELDKFAWYYLNSFMTNTVEGKKFIVDGQQRLTTLTLIHIALYHLGQEYELPPYLIDAIKKSIHDTYDYGVSFCMGIKDRKDVIKHLFENSSAEYNQGEYKNQSEQNIYNNYKKILSILQEKLILDDNQETKHKLHFFTLYFRNKIYLVEIEIDDAEDIPMVFEVINDRGVPLESYEILKGKLLGQIKPDHIQEYLDIWEDKIPKLEYHNGYKEDNIDDFFHFYFRSKYTNTQSEYSDLGEKKYHRLIFINPFNDRIGLKRNVKNVKDFIKTKFPYYCDKHIFVRSKSDKYDEDYKHIHFNWLNGINGYFPLILSSLILNDPSEDEKIKLVSSLFDRNFVILHLTDSYRSNDFGHSVITLVKNIRDKDLSEIKKEFDIELLRNIMKSKGLANLKVPFKYEFFKNVGYATSGLNPKFLRYFFARIEHYIADMSKLPVKDYILLVNRNRGYESHHIEHIISNHEDNVALFNDEDEFNTQRNRLGGLLLMNGRDNSSSNNELYRDKLKTYESNGIWYTQTLLQNMYKSKKNFTDFIEKEKIDFKPYSEYDKDAIEERQKLLYQIVKKIWDVKMDSSINFDNIPEIDDTDTNEEE